MSDSVITRIVMFLVFPLAFIAMLISLTGFKGPIQFDESYYNFLQKVSLDMNSWKINIPDIPPIPLAEGVGAGWDILRVLTNIVNFIVILLNIIIGILNTIIELVQFIIALIRNVVGFSESGFSDSGSLSFWN